VAEILTDWTETYKEYGALWQMQDVREPHAATTTSNEHVSAYFLSENITARPSLVVEIVNTALLPHAGSEELVPDWVFTYAPYGLFVASACANTLGAQQGYVKPADNYTTTYDVQPGDEVLVVSDDLYSGGSLKKTIGSMQQMGAVVLPYVFTLANLSGDSHLDGRKILAGAHIPVERYPGDDCAMCDGGSEPLAPRPNWERLQSHEIPGSSE
jgi:adenine/guanine phosphoribosyltransferase-like PRPP-binding protein